MKRIGIFRRSWQQLSSYLASFQEDQAGRSCANSENELGTGNALNVDELHLMLLEPRILYDASPLGAIIDTGDSNDLEVLEGSFDQIAEIAPVSELEPSITHSIDVMLDLASEDDFVMPPPGGEIVFVDGRIDGHDELVEDLLTSSVAQGQSYRVVVLNNETSGINQISKYLGGYHNYETVHVVSHGSQGVLQLGGTTLTADNIGQYEEQIMGWGAGLTQSADILLYGCDVAGSESGQWLVEEIASLTSADVAASDDLTGHENLGGDWAFEYTVGVIETDLIFSMDVQQNWAGVFNINAPTDLSSGIEINSDGGNDAVLVVASDGNSGDIGDVIGGLSAFTLEVSFSADDMNRQTLLSYAATDPDGNDILLRVDEFNGFDILTLTINGSSNQINPYGFDYKDVLLDGAQHTLSISWDNTAGDWAVYVDGTFIESGNGLAVGQTVAGDASTGHFVLGNEQDNVGGGFNPNDNFRGTYYDVRIWDTARNQAEIADTYGKKIDASDVPTGLVANWQMDGFDDSSAVVDIVGGNNLSVANATGSGFSPSTPIHDLHVTENPANDSRVGYVVPHGNFDSALAFNLVDDAGGRFAIDSMTGEITVVDGTLIDHENARSHDITVEVSTVDGDSYSETMSIKVNNRFDVTLTVPEAQTIVESSNLTFTVGTPTEVSVTSLAALDTPLQVSLSVNDGALTLSQTMGLDFMFGSNGSDNFVLNGTVADINAALDGMIFTPNEKFAGEVTLEMNVALSADLQGHFGFESGSANDTSVGPTNHGTFNGDAITTVDPVRGEVLVLDAAGDNVRIAGRFDEPASVTLSAWVNVDKADSEIISIGNRVLIRADSTLASGSIDAVFNNGTEWIQANNGEPIAGTGWRHVAMTVNDVTKISSLYIDGELAATTSFTGSISYNSDIDTFIGANPFNSTYDFGGMIDDARIYSRSLSADEISEIANSSAQTSEAVEISVIVVNEAPTFNVGDGIVVDDVSGGNSDKASDLYILPDGKTLVAGTAQGSWSYDFTVVRYNQDGTLDTTFGVNGLAQIDTGNNTDTTYSIAVQENGKIVVAGAAGTNAFGLARFNADGSVDTSFGTNGYVVHDASDGGDRIESIDIDSAGNIVVTGFINSTSEDTAVMRFDSTGAVDTSFGVNGMVSMDLGPRDAGRAVSVLENGSIVVLAVDNMLGSSDIVLFKLGQNGEIDPSFGTNGIVKTDVGTSTDQGRDMIVQPDGKIVVVGITSSSQSNVVLVRYNIDGSLDSSFGVGGVAEFALATNDDSTSVALQSDGSFVVTGRVFDSDFDLLVARVDSTGIIDNTFGSEGIVTLDLGGHDYGTDVAVASDGTIQVAGYSNGAGNDDFVLIKLNADGTLETNFARDISTLDGNPTFIEGGVPVVLDADVEIFDAELNAIDDFGGATLTLMRNGGANSDDVFSATGNLRFNSGTLALSGTDIGSVTQNNGAIAILFNSGVTNAQVNEVLRSIAYQNTNEAAPENVQIDWRFNDGNDGAQGSGGAGEVTGATVVNISAVNDAPVLDPSGQPTFATISEDDVDNTGMTVANLLATGAGGNPISDPDGDPEGIAITSLTGNGTWQYDNGIGWTDVGMVNDNSALLLRNTASVRYVPDEFNGEVANFEFRAWDQTTGMSGSKSDTTTSGGSTAFSRLTDVAVIHVNDVNDAPVLSGSMNMTSITEDDLDNNGDSILNIILSGGNVITDVDANAEGLAVVARNHGNGEWEYSINNGVTWNLMSSVSDSNALLLGATDRVRFIPNGENAAAPWLDVRAWDLTTGTAGNIVDASENGGTTAFSTGVERISLLVTEVADAPMISNLDGDTFTYEDGDGAAVIDQATASLVDDSDSDDFDGGTLTVSMPVGNSPTVDVLGVRNQGAGPGQVGVSGSTISYEGTNVGTSVGGTFGVDLVVTFNASATSDAVSAVLQNITYENGNADATTGQREVTFVLTDGDGGTSSTQSVTIEVVYIPDPVGVVVPVAQAVNEDLPLEFSIANGNAITVDSGQSDNPTMTAELTVSNGQLNLAITSGITFTDGTENGRSTVAFSGTESDINAALDGLRYVGDQDFFGNDSISVTASTEFSSSVETVSLTVIAVNDLPTFINLDGSTTFHEGAAPLRLDADVEIFDAELSVFDDFGGASLTVQRNFGGGPEDVFGAVGNLVFNGTTLELSGTSIGTIILSPGSVTLEFNSGVTNVQMNEVLQSITYQNTSENPPSTVHMVWIFSDGNDGSQGAGPPIGNTVLQSYTIVSENDAPVLDNSGVLEFDSITEDELANSGNTIAELLASDNGFPSPITDVDGDPDGIAITTASGNGTWQYDNGVGWTDVGVVSIENAWLLRATDSLRYVPNGEHGESATILFLAWDQSAGDPGTKADASIGGGTSAFSNLIEAATINVSDVNDRPDAVNDSFVNAIGNSLTINVATDLLDNDSDIEDDVLTIDSFTQPANGSVIDNGDGTLTYTAMAGYTDDDFFTYTVSDGNDTSTASVLIQQQGVWSIVGGGIVEEGDAASYTISFNGTENATVDLSLTDIDTTSADYEDFVAAMNAAVSGRADLSFDGRTIEFTGNGSVMSELVVNLDISDDVTVESTEIFQVDLYNQTNSFLSLSNSATTEIQDGNIAPVLDNSIDLTMDSITEDDFNNGGMSISALLATGANNDPISDANGNSAGIALVSTIATGGNFQYSIDGGASWSDVGNVSDGSALLLAESSMIRFVPDRENGEFASFEFRAWDQFEGVAGDRLDATSSGASSPFSVETGVANIVVTDVNDAPVMTMTDQMSFTSVFEDATNPAGDTVADIIASGGGDRITDVDNGAVEGIAVNFADSANGTWEYSLDGGNSWLDLGSPTVSQSRLLGEDSMLRFIPNADYHGSAYITFRAWDQTTGTIGGLASNAPSSTGAFSTSVHPASIEVNAVNDQPDFGGTLGQHTAYNEGGSAIYIDQDVQIFDTELTALDNFGGAELAVSFTGGGTHVLTKDGSAISSSDPLVQNGVNIGTVSPFVADTQTFTFNANATSELVNQFMQSLTYENTGTFLPDSIQVNWQFIDGNSSGNQGSGGVGSDLGNTTIEIIGLNSAPDLDSSGLLTFDSITEDDVDNNGTTVADLLANGTGGDPITDADGDSEGIAIIGVNAEIGYFQYSIDGGTTWSDVGSVSGSEALLLDSSNMLRFQPDGENGGTSSLNFRAWDQTSGSVGDKVALNNTGGNSSVSTNVETAIIVVTDVNDAPVMDHSGLMSLSDVVEDDPNPAGNTVAEIIASAGGDRITDVDNGAVEGIAVYGAETTNGAWEYSIDAGATWLDLGLADSNHAFLLDESSMVRFIPSANFNGTATLTIKAWDQTTGVSGDIIRLADAVSELSAELETIVVTVTSLNDAPIIDLDSNDDTALGVNFQGVFIAGDGPVNVADTDVSIDDVDSSAITSLVVRITNLLDGADESLSVALPGAGWSQFYNSGAGELTIVPNPSTTFADWETVIQSIQYNNLAVTPNTTTRVIEFEASDGIDTNSPLAESHIEIGYSVNTAPTFVVGDGNVILDVSGGDDRASQTVTQPDGKSLVVGESNNDYMVTRFNVDGTVDTTFGSGGSVILHVQGNDEGRAIELQTDGKILIAGFANADQGVVRLNTDGSLDTSYGVGGYRILSQFDLYDTLDLQLQPDGKLLVVGNAWQGGFTDQQFAVSRLDTDGNLDTSFANNGSYVTAFPPDLVQSGWATEAQVQSDGKILVSQRYYTSSGWMYGWRRLNTNGTLDTSFGNSGNLFPATGAYADFVLNPDDSFVAAGNIASDYAIAKFDANGNLDTSFGIGGITTLDLNEGSIDSATDIIRQDSGKYVVNGTTRVGAERFIALARFNADGTVDTSFGNNGITITDVAVTNINQDGDLANGAEESIQVVGTYNGDIVSLKVNENGTVDTTYDSSATNTLDHTATFAEGGSPVLLDPNVKIYDAELSLLNDFDNTKLTLVREGGPNADDVFGFQDGNGFVRSDSTIQFNGITIANLNTTPPGQWVVTFSSDSGTTANQQIVNNVMSQLTYENVSSVPPGSVQIDWTFSDRNLDASQGVGGELTATGKTTVNVIASNDAPDLDNSIDLNLTSVNEDDTDPDGDSVADILASAGTDPITDADGDPEGIALIGTDNSNGTWQYKISAGDPEWIDVPLILAGDGLLLNADSMIRFVPDADHNGNGGNIAFRAWDGSDGEAAGTVTTIPGSGGAHAYSVGVETARVDVLSVNDAPELVNLDGGSTYIEGSAPILLDADAEIFDAELSAIDDFGGAVLSLSRAGGSDAEDLFSPTGNLVFNGTDLELSGATIGGVTNSNGLLFLAFNAGTTNAQVNEVIQSIAYSNTSDTPAAAVEINWSFFDGNSGSQGPEFNLDTTASTVVSIVETNDDPILTANLGVATYNEGGTETLVARLAAVSDADSIDFGGGTLTATVAGNGEAADRLFVMSGISEGRSVIIAGSDILVDSVVVATFNGGNGAGDPLVVTFNSNATSEEVERVTSRIAFASVSENPSELERTVTIQLTDGDFGTSDEMSQIVRVVAYNDTPNAIGPSSFDATEQIAYELTGNGLTVFDPDSPDGSANTIVTLNVGEGTLEITQGNSSVGMALIDSSTLNLTGTIGEINNLLSGSTTGSIAYLNSSQDPSASTNLIMTINDGGNNGIDPGTTGDGTFEEDTSVTVINIASINDAPRTGTSNSTASEDAAFLAITVNGSDVDGTVEHFVISNLPANGTLYSDSSLTNAVVAGADIDAIGGSLTLYFTPNSDWNGVTTFNYVAKDDLGLVDATPATGTFIVQAVNDEQVLVNNSGGSIFENDSFVFNSGHLLTTDVDNSPLTIVYTIDSTAISGDLLIDGVTVLGVNDTFTQADIDAGRISYQNDGSETTSDSFSFTVDDGVGATISDTFEITINAVNDAPVLENSGTPILTNIQEDEVNSGGDSVLEILNSVGNPITDDDIGAVEGIAVTSVDDSNGTWQYSLNGGFSWKDFGAVSESSAVLLTDSAQIRFVPGKDFHGTPSGITYRAWDQTFGSEGDTGIDTTSNGGSTAFSVTQETATMDVIAVNDSPVLEIGADLEMTTITENDADNNGDLVSDILSTAAGGVTLTDVDAGSVEGIAINGYITSNHGSWQYSTDGGTTWINVGAVDNENSLLLAANDRLRFVPDAIAGETAILSFKAWDQTAGIAGTKVDTSVTGGSSAYSDNSETITINVTDVNDAPVLDYSGNTTLAAINEDNTDPVGQTVADILVSGGVNQITDLDELDVPGIAVTGVNDTNGSWQYSIDGGTSWWSFANGGVSTTGIDPSSAVLLDTSALLRFVPDPDFSGDTSQLSYQAWDQSDSNINGAVGIDATYSGDESAFSRDTETLETFVNPINDSPTLSTNYIAMVNEGDTVPLNGFLSTFDVDDAADELTVSLLTVPLNGQLELTTNPGIAITSFTMDQVESGEVVYVHNASETSVDSFTFRISDGGEDDSIPIVDEFNIEILPINDAPVLLTNQITIVEGSSTVLSLAELSAADVDNLDSSVTLVVQNVSGGQFELLSNPGVAVASFTVEQVKTGEVQFIDDGDEFGPSYEIFVTDGLESTVPEAAVVNFINANDEQALIENNTLNLNEGATRIISALDLQTIDEDHVAADLVYTVSTSPINGHLELAGEVGVSITRFTQADIDSNQVVYVHNGSETTMDSFVFDVDDGLGTTTTGVFDFSIDSINDVPIVNSINLADVNEGGVTSISSSHLDIIDVDDNTTDVVVSLTIGPNSGHLALAQDTTSAVTSFTLQQLNDADIVYVHNGAETLSDSFGFSIADSATTVSGFHFEINVIPVNDAPDALDDSYVVDEDTTLSPNVQLDSNDTDADGDILTTTLLSGPTHALEFTLNSDGSFVYTPELDFFGTDSFSYQVSDGNGGFDTASVEIEVYPVNDTPRGQNDAFTVVTGETLAPLTSLLDNDTDVENDPLSALLVSTPTKGLVLLDSDGTFQYIPFNSYVGFDTFTYVANDGTGDSNPITVTISFVGSLEDNGNDVEQTKPQGNAEELIFVSEPNDQTDSEGEERQTGTVDLAQLIIPRRRVEFETDNSFTEFDFEFTQSKRQLLDVITDRQIALNIFEYLLNGNGTRIDTHLDDPGITSYFDIAKLASQLSDDDDQLGDLLGLETILGTVTMAGTAGFVLWSMRGGLLLATALTYAPTWTMIDPLPILDSYPSKDVKDDKDLDQMFS